MQFSISHLFAHSFNVKQFLYDKSDATTVGQSDLGAIAVKGYSAFPKN